MHKKSLVGMVIVVSIIMVATPIIIHICSSEVSSEISADGLLDYLGNCMLLFLLLFWQ